MKFEVRDGNFFYDKNHYIFKNVNFEVNKGEVLAILGQNGVGKTTLVKCMLNFLNFKSGGSYLNDINTKNINLKEFWSDVAYVPQVKRTFANFSAVELITLGKNASFNAFKTPSKNDYDEAKSLLDRLNMSHIKDKWAHSMSGGELQMCLIARALIIKPKILVMDEPESNLDFKNQLMILKTIQNLSNNGISIILNTHYIEHALEISHKSLLMKKGKSAIFGKSSEIITEDILSKIYDVDIIIKNFDIKNEKKYFIKAV